MTLHTLDRNSSIFTYGVLLTCTFSRSDYPGPDFECRVPQPPDSAVPCSYLYALYLTFVCFPGLHHCSKRLFLVRCISKIQLLITIDINKY